MLVWTENSVSLPLLSVSVDGQKSCPSLWTDKSGKLGYFPSTGAENNTEHKFTVNFSSTVKTFFIPTVISWCSLLTARNQWSLQWLCHLYHFKNWLIDWTAARCLCLPPHLKSSACYLLRVVVLRAVQFTHHSPVISIVRACGAALTQTTMHLAGHVWRCWGQVTA